MTDLAAGPAVPAVDRDGRPARRHRPRPRHRPDGRAARRAPFGLRVTGLVIGAGFAAPLGYLVWRNTGSEAGAVLWSSDTLEPLGRTVVLAVAVGLSCSVVGTALAWVTTRTDVPLRRVWRALAPLPLVFPSFVGAIALLTALAPGGLLAEAMGPLGFERLPRIEGLRGAWLVLTLFTYPLVYLPVRARLASLPASLEESARLLGHGPWSVFRTVVVPQVAAAVSAGSLLVFLYVLSDFGVVQLMRYDTLTRVIFENKLARQEIAFGAALLLALLALSVVVVERAVTRRRLFVEVARQGEPLTVELGRWRWPVFALTSFFLANALAAPVASLTYWVWRDARDDPDGLAAVTGALGDLVGPAWNTAFVGVVASAVAVVVVLPLAYLTTRYRSASGVAAMSLVVSGYALPGLAIALALVFWALNVPVLDRFYQTLPWLVLAYVVHFGAQAMRSSQVAVSGVPRSLDDAGRSLGAGRVRRFVTIELPLMRAGLAAGAGLVLLSVMKELPATLLLAPTGFDTLSLEIWKAQELHSFAQVGLASLMLVAVSGVLTWMLVVRRADDLG